LRQGENQVRKDAFWFGESQSRIVVSVSPASKQKFESALQSLQQPFQFLGTVKSRDLIVDGENWGILSDWRKPYDEKISSLMK